MRFARPFTTTSVLKSEFFFSISSEKRLLLPALGCWPIIWPISSSSPGYTIHSDYYTDLYVPFSIHPVGDMECRYFDLHSNWIRYFGREELTYITYSSFNGQSLSPVNLNTEGQWEIDLPSLPSLADHVTIYTYIYNYLCGGCLLG